MRSLFSNTINRIGRDIVTVIALVAAMFWIDWILSCVTFFVFPLVAYPVFRIGQRMRRVSANTQIEMAQFTTLQDESFQGIRHVKAYGMEDYETGRASFLVSRIFRLNYKAEKIRAITEPLLEVIAGLAIAGVLLYGGYQVIAGARTPAISAFHRRPLLSGLRSPCARAGASQRPPAGRPGGGGAGISPSSTSSPRSSTARRASAGSSSPAACKLDDVVFAYDRRSAWRRPPGARRGGVTLDIPGRQDGCAGRTVRRR